MIKTKGPYNIHVVARNNVPVYDICDAVAEHKSLEWIQNRYMITEDEVFECLDTYVDLAEKNPFQLTLRCAADETDSDIYIIDTSHINDKMYFSILIYGRLFFETKDLHELFTYALNLIIIESVLDFRENSSQDPESMHMAVFEAFEESYGRIDESNVDHILTQLDHNTLMRLMKHAKTD
jgi:hypothetical protein